MKESIAFKQGKKAASLGVPLEKSGLVNLNPDSERYDQFIAGYDSHKESDDLIVLSSNDFTRSVSGYDNPDK